MRGSRSSGRYAPIIRLIQREYAAGEDPWYLAFSGGKDSCALLTLVFQSICRLPNPRRPITVVYCDTGVEIPPIRDFAVRTLRKFAKEATSHRLPMAVQVVRPSLDDRFFVKVIGRGYPPPTNKFRWCTRRLRISPLKKLISLTHSGETTILLGTRLGESGERDRVLRRYRENDMHYFRQDGIPTAKVLAPLLHCDATAVWRILRSGIGPRSLNTQALSLLYESATACGAECKQSSGARFGCWTCTVVRKDRALMSMVNDGHPHLLPLLEYRDSLARMRDNPRFRWSRRRNGDFGLGPMTIKAREILLQRLKQVQASVPWKLISSREEDRIRQLWADDRHTEEQSIS